MLLLAFRLVSAVLDKQRNSVENAGVYAFPSIYDLLALHHLFSDLLDQTFLLSPEILLEVLS